MAADVAFLRLIGYIDVASIVVAEWRECAKGADKARERQVVRERAKERGYQRAFRHLALIIYQHFLADTFLLEWERERSRGKERES